MTTLASAPPHQRETGAEGCGFGREFRLLKSREFERARKNGRNLRGRMLVLYGFSREEGGATKLGVSVSKRIGNAVTRNRIKRVLREAFRTGKGAFPIGTDIMVIARHAAATAKGIEIGGELLTLGKKLKRA